MIVLSLLLIILSVAVALRRDRSIFYNKIAIIALLYSLLFSLNNTYINNMETGIGLFGGLFHTSANTQVFHGFVLLISIIILQLTGFYPEKFEVKDTSSNVSSIVSTFLNKQGYEFTIIEYPLILLFVVIGAIFLMSTSDLVSVFLSIELQSYGLYLLGTTFRDSELATSGSLTYFLLGGLSSCFILLGTALLYANSGTTNIDGIYIITSISDISEESKLNIIYKSEYINIALLILTVGFLFKVSAAPFHFWSPYVYDAIPTIVTIFVAIIAKISIFIFLLELVHYTSNSLFINEFNWIDILLISSLLSLIIGTVLGLTQSRVKRLYAYSTISHVGFILLALSINSVESIQAFLFYLIQYSLSNLNSFMILIAMGFYVSKFTTSISASFYNLKEKMYSPIQLISQMKGFIGINYFLALSSAITIFSFAGIPPLIGFFAKQMVLSAALDSGYIFMAIVAILTSVIGAVYYLNIIKQMFFDKSEYNYSSIVESDIVINTIKSSSLKIRFIPLLSGDDSVIIKKLADEFGTVTEKDLGNFLYNEKDYIVINKSESNKNVKDRIIVEKLGIREEEIKMSDYLTITISILTLIMLLFFLAPREWLSMTNMLSLIIFNT
jgi:NADH-ubiquinone oxidoreductase chain 2